MQYLVKKMGVNYKYFQLAMGKRDKKDRGKLYFFHLAWGKRSLRSSRIEDQALVAGMRR